jgi:hypothetical protein
MSVWWLTPAALAGLALLAVPIAIHLFARTPVRRIVVPSLRPVAAQVPKLRRRRHVRDRWLLAVRLLTVAAAVAASAGPLLVTPAREAQWARRATRAVIVDGAVASGAAAGVIEQAIAAATAGAMTAEVFTADPADSAVPGALAWLSRQPPATREIVVVGDGGSALAPSTLGLLPAGTGIRVEDVAAGADLQERAWLGGSLSGQLLAARVRWSSDATGGRTRLDASPRPQLPVTQVADAETQPVVDAVWNGVQAEGAFLRASVTWQPVRVEWPGAATVASASVVPLTEDDRARLWPLTTLAGAGGEPVASASAPWSWLAPGVVAARDGGTLVIRSTQPAEPGLVADLLRAVLQVAAGEERPPRRPGAAERLARAAMTRPAVGVPPTAMRQAAGGDARWLWAAALAGLIVESMLRRRRDDRTAVPSPQARTEARP